MEKKMRSRLQGSQVQHQRSCCILDSLDAGKAAEIRPALRRAGTSVLEGPTSQATPTMVTAPVQSVPELGLREPAIDPCREP